ncbi:transposase [Xenorhabdus thuongxuanensis]|uniref:Transposase n=1 Tax=Xenorhabdus thuongxuanensis TaxID=1873484 RepID=A0A1Q5U3Z1_9GAMM|nr:transposase [Xenorhabdus thuongxuanensis]
MAAVEVQCRFCHKTKEVKKQGTGKGGHQRYRWLWYTWEPRLKRIIAHTFGK